MLTCTARLWYSEDGFDGGVTSESWDFLQVCVELVVEAVKVGKEGMGAEKESAEEASDDGEVKINVAVVDKACDEASKEFPSSTNSGADCFSE